MEKILVLEDSSFDYELIKASLGNTYKLFWAKKASEVDEFISNEKFDLILLDVVLDEGSGFEICSKLRNIESTKDIPIIFISGKKNVNDKVMGFQLGADDYLTKPFEALELRARIERKLKILKDNQGKDEIRNIGPLKLILPSNRVLIRINNEESDLGLTPTEFRMLWVLSRRVDQIFSRNQLLDSVYNNNINVTDRTVDSHIRSLRRKLGRYSNYIETVYGAGYRFVNFDSKWFKTMFKSPKKKHNYPVFKLDNKDWLII